MLCLPHLQSNNTNSNAAPHANILAYTLHFHSQLTRHTHTPAHLHTRHTHTLAHTTHTFAPPTLTRPHTRLCHTRNTTKPSPLTQKNKKKITMRSSSSHGFLVKPTGCFSCLDPIRKRATPHKVSAKCAAENAPAACTKKSK